MSTQMVEVELPAELVEQIDAKVGADQRAAFLTKVAKDAVHRSNVSDKSDRVGEDEVSRVPSTGRFKPIVIRGEQISDTIARDRGNL